MTTSSQNSNEKNILNLLNELAAYILLSPSDNRRMYLLKIHSHIKDNCTDCPPNNHLSQEEIIDILTLVNKVAKCKSDDDELPANLNRLQELGKTIGERSEKNAELADNLYKFSSALIFVGLVVVLTAGFMGPLPLAIVAAGVLAVGCIALVKGLSTSANSDGQQQIAQRISFFATKTEDNMNTQRCTNERQKEIAEYGKHLEATRDLWVRV